TDMPPDSPWSDTVARLARAGTMMLPLRGLSGPDLGELVSASAGIELDEERLSTLADRTGGNPFYPLELARLSRRTGVTDTVPNAVGDVVRARLARLPESSRGALLMAAALGRTFDVGVLSAATGTDVAATAEALDGAVAIRLLVDDERGRMRFAHAI